MDSNSKPGALRLWRSLAASAALHALLLAQPPAADDSPPAARPLAASLRQALPQPRREPEPRARKTVAAASGSPERAAAPGPAEHGASAEADGLRAYRFGLAAAASRLKRYPPAAIERGLGGRVELSLEVAVGGHSLPPRVMSSSGSSLLDEAALDLVARAALATTVPASLRHAAFTVRVPLEFAAETP